MKQLNVKSRRILPFLLVLVMVMQIFSVSVFATGDVIWSIPDGKAVVGEKLDLLKEVTAVAGDGTVLTVEVFNVTSTDEDYTWNGMDTTITPKAAGEYKITYHALNAEDSTAVDTYSRTVTVDSAEGGETGANGLISGWSPSQGTRDGGEATGNDITGEITFSDGQLTVGTTIVEEDDSLSISYRTKLEFKINWAASSLNASYSQGDFFTFTIPADFGSALPEAGLEMIGSDGEVWGVITFSDNEDGTYTATATFNGNIEGQTVLSGQITLSVEYSDLVGGPIDWTFEFSDKIYEYEGTAKPRPSGTQNLIKEQVIDKSGNYQSNYGAYFWTVYANEQTDNWNGKMIITDTLGPGQKIIPYANTGSANPNSAYSFKVNSPAGDDNVYFRIFLLDYDKMREEYNTMVREYQQSGNDPTQLTGVSEALYKVMTGTYTYDFYRDENGDVAVVPDNLITNFMKGRLIWFQYPGTSYRYLKSYSKDAIYIELTEDGFVIEMENIGENGLYIEYYTQLTALMAQDELTNIVKVEHGETNAEDDGSVRVGSSATVTGVNGSITLLKSNTAENDYFSDVAFSLEIIEQTELEAGENPSKTMLYEETSSGGSLIFNLGEYGVKSYAGTYKLTEDSSTTPAEYTCADPIILKLNTNGAIVSVNDNPVSSTSGLMIEDVCRVSKDGLLITVYNKKTQEKEVDKGGFTMTKVDSDDDAKTLPDAKFKLYYVINDTNYYYAIDEGDNTVSWITDESAATVLITDEWGKISVTDLEYKTYYLEETEAPEGYELDSTPVEIEIDAQKTTVTEKISNDRTVDLTVKKVDADKKDILLNGANFILYYIEDNVTYYYKNPGWENDPNAAASLITADGKFQLDDLKVGRTYILEETEVPDGYNDSQVGRKVYIVVDNEGNITTNQGDQIPEYSSYDDVSKTLTIENTKSKTDLTFLKVDASDRDIVLPLAEFSLYVCNDEHTHGDGSECTWTYVTDAKSDEQDGFVNFTELVPGFYKLEETKAPTGYELPTGHWLFTLQADGTLDEESITASVSGYTLAMVYEDEVYKILNQRKLILPLLASSGSIRIFTVVGILLLSAGVFLAFRRKRRTII